MNRGALPKELFGIPILTPEEFFEQHRVAGNGSSKGARTSSRGVRPSSIEEFLQYAMSPDQILEDSGGELDWLISGYLARGNITSLAGLAKDGKTTLMGHKVRAMATEGEIFGIKAKRSGTLWITEQGDNICEVIKDVNLGGLHNVSFIQRKNLTGIPWPELVDFCIEACDKLGRGTLVVDTFATFAGLTSTEENNSGDVHEAFIPLKNASEIDGLCVALIRHSNKEGKGRGSSQFEGEADILLEMKMPEGNHKETVRKLEGKGRSRLIPRSVNIELTKEAYIALGSDAKIEFN
jgi:hypothetical protein